ncbi:DUF4307 domain-containing protein [Nocardioides speluncae]|uniref:DUF4307 domain-containing protein n=1 Tax=Nocardioides speluncae TaxID=2670337 RepID=UPI001379B2A4|nr:DUF4307 domain-containing protein [Nocardioides speluncae]
MTSDSAVLDDRYGRRRPGRRLLLIGVSVAFFVVFGGWLAWVMWDSSTPEVESDLLAWEVVDDHSVTARVDVRLRDRNVEATCKLRAYAEDHTNVGELSFAVPGPDFDEDGPIEVTIRTERMATSVERIGCTTPTQKRPR